VCYVSKYLITGLGKQDDERWLLRKSVAGAGPEVLSKEDKRC